VLGLRTATKYSGSAAD